MDLTKAFDTMNHDGLWKIMAKFSVQEKVINMVQLFHDGMFARVIENDESSKPFAVLCHID